MSRWAYYAPMLLTFLAVLGLNEPIRQAAPPRMLGGPWAYVLVLAAIVALGAQILMLGSQGVAARVLPAPGGRSIRGGAAQAAGYCAIAAVAAGVAFGLLAIEGMSIGGWTAGIVTALLALTGIGVYVWSWPTAVRDFAED